MEVATALNAPDDVVVGFIIGRVKVFCCKPSMCVSVCDVVLLC